MSHGTHTHWRMTINNYDANDMALVTQGYPDHIRQMVWTLEEGENGTPHIQAYIKMKRDVRCSHMSKLFPRGNFGYCDSLEYKLNQQRYAQKTDDTTRSAHVIINGDPLHTVEGTVRRVIERIIRDYDDDEDTELGTCRRWTEQEMVKEDYTMAKVFVSAVYKSMWKEFGHEMFSNIRHTHTHTHTQEVEVPTAPPEIFSQQESITNAIVQGQRDAESAAGSWDQGSCDQGESSDASQEGSDCDGEGSGSEGSGEQDDW